MWSGGPDHCLDLSKFDHVVLGAEAWLGLEIPGGPWPGLCP